MSARRVSPPKRAVGRSKKGQSKEETERLLREERERHEKEELLKREKEAEEKQRLDNELRDKLENRERKRMKKDAQARGLSEKEALIAQLTQQLSELSRNYTSMKQEMDDELRRILQLKEGLENELSNTQAELQAMQQDWSDQRSESEKAMQNLHEEFLAMKGAKEELKTKSEAQIQQLTKQVSKLSAEAQLLRSSKEHTEKELSDRVRMLERELEKSMSLTRTLQDVVESKEMEDRKNLTLMELVNQQLDDQKFQASKALQDERQRSETLTRNLDDAIKRLSQSASEQDALRRENDNLKDEVSKVTNAFKSQMDKLKVDTKFLHSELSMYKSKLHNAAQSHSTTLESTSADREALIQQVELGSRKVEELEAQAKKRERENFDKVTFLNAQISNNRSIILQLQQKLQQEKDTRLAEVGALTEEIASKARKIAEIESEFDMTKLKQSESQVKLSSDVNMLKTTTFQLQSQLFDKDREAEALLLEKDEEIRRLKRKLDEAFIPYRF